MNQMVNKDKNNNFPWSLADGPRQKRKIFLVPSKEWLEFLLLFFVFFFSIGLIFSLKEILSEKIFITGIPTEVLGYISQALYYQLSYSNNVTQWMEN